MPVEMNVTIRPYLPADQLALTALLDPDAGEIWERQFFPLHGATGTQTLVAQQAGKVVGAVSVGQNPLHPTGIACAVDVHPAYRRQGIGTALLQAMRQASGDSRPFRTKVQTPAAEQFVLAQGGRVYQVSPGHVMSPVDEANQTWARAVPLPDGVTLVSAAEVDPSAILAAFVDLYVWQHAAWNPVGSREVLTAALAEELAAIDRSLTLVARREGRIVALALAFPADVGGLDVVAETTSEDLAHGREVLAAMIARLVLRAAEAGWDRLVFDGHLTDPHLEPVLVSVPQLQSGPPLLLMEIPI